MYITLSCMTAYNKNDSFTQVSDRRTRKSGWRVTSWRRAATATWWRQAAGRSTDAVAKC